MLSWLLMLTHRRAVDRVRSVTSAVLRDQREFHRTGETTGDVAEAVVDAQEARGIRGAVDRLPHKQRNAVTLTYLTATPCRRPRRCSTSPWGR